MRSFSLSQRLQWVRVRRHLSFLALAVGVASLAASGPARAQDRIVTEWTSPTLNSDPVFALPVSSDIIYFSEVAGGKIAKLNTETSDITEWTLSQAHDQVFPGGLIQVGSRIFFGERRPSSSNPFTGGIGALQPATGQLTEWTTPGGFPQSPVYRGQHIYFIEASGGIGSLNPNTNDVREWQNDVREWQLPSLSVGPVDGSLDIDENGKDLWIIETPGPVLVTSPPTQNTLFGSIARLDVSTSTLTEWPLPKSARASRVHVQEDFVYFSAGNTIMRLDPATNVISAWTDPNTYTCPPVWPGGPCNAEVTDVSPTEIDEGANGTTEPVRMYVDEGAFGISTPFGSLVVPPAIGEFVTTAAPHTDYVVTPTTTILTAVDSTAVVATLTATNTVTHVEPVITTVHPVKSGDFTFWKFPPGPGGPAFLSKFSDGRLIFAESIRNKIGLFAMDAGAADDDK